MTNNTQQALEAWNWIKWNAESKVRNLELDFEVKMDCIRTALESPMTLPDGWRLVEDKTCYKLCDGNEIVALLTGEDAKENATKIASFLSTNAIEIPKVMKPLSEMERFLVNRGWTRHSKHNWSFEGDGPMGLMDAISHHRECAPEDFVDYAIAKIKGE